MHATYCDLFYIRLPCHIFQLLARHAWCSWFCNSYFVRVTFVACAQTRRSPMMCSQRGAMACRPHNGSTFSLAKMPYWAPLVPKRSLLQAFCTCPRVANFSVLMFARRLVRNVFSRCPVIVRICLCLHCIMRVYAVCVCVCTYVFMFLCI